LLSTLEVSLTLDHQEPPDIFSQGFLGFYKHMRVPVFANVIETGTEERVKYVFGLKPDDITLEALLSLEHRNNTQLSDWSVYLSIVVDENGNIIGLYVGSGIGRQDVFGRWVIYDRARESKAPLTGEKLGRYLSAALEKGITMYIRCLWRRPQATTNAA
jgi:hypothetical protein